MMDVNGFFDYRDPSYGNDSSCWLRVYRLPDDIAVVIATELAENKGPSVTNTAEAWARAAVEEYDLDPAKTHFFENYERTPTDRLETWDRVEFDWIGAGDDDEVPWGYPTKARWTPASKKEIEKLIDEKLAPIGSSY
jgi:hypothetical protein